MMGWQCTLQKRMGETSIDVSLTGGDAPTVVIGPNGAGKSSILKMIVGGVTPNTGRIVLNDKCLYEEPGSINLPPECRGVGYMPQGYGLFPHLSVLENVLFGVSKTTQMRTKARTLLERLDAIGLVDRKPSSLSGGEGQCVALARVLMTSPSLMLLDEPLAAVDVAAKSGLRQFLIGHLKEEAIPAIVVTHDRGVVTSLGGNLVVLEAGQIVAQGAYADIREQAATPFIRAFFSD